MSRVPRPLNTGSQTYTVSTNAIEVYNDASPTDLSLTFRNCSYSIVDAGTPTFFQTYPGAFWNTFVKSAIPYYAFAEIKQVTVRYTPVDFLAGSAG